MKMPAAALPRGVVVPHPHGPLDVVHLARQTLGDWALGLEVLRIFDEMSRTYAGRLAATDSRGDLLENLHSLRSAAHGVGAFALAQLARAAEDELASGARVDPERIADIAMAVEEVSAYIAALVEEDALLSELAAGA